MTDEFDPLSMIPTPTAQRPLLGLTVLVVEDSRFASEAVRLLCLRSGARIRRADSLASAHKHLRTYRPNVVIVDLGLPDGSGAELIDELGQAANRVEVLLGMSGDTGTAAIAMAAGADGFIEKPIASLSQFQEIVLSALPENAKHAGLHAVSDELVEPDPHALQDDFMHISDLLSNDVSGDILDYIAQFLEGVAKSAGDQEVAQAAHDLSQCREAGGAFGPHVARIAGLVHQRIDTQRVV